MNVYVICTVYYVNVNKEDVSRRHPQPLHVVYSHVDAGRALGEKLHVVFMSHTFDSNHPPAPRCDSK